MSLSLAAQLGHDTMRDLANIKALVGIIKETDKHDGISSSQLNVYLDKIAQCEANIRMTVDNFYIASQPKPDLDNIKNSLELE